MDYLVTFTMRIQIEAESPSEAIDIGCADLERAFGLGASAYFDTLAEPA